MERTKYTIFFIVKESKLLQNGEAPLYARITIEKERTECSLYRSIPVKLWDKTKQRVKGNSEFALEINSYLESVRNKLYFCYSEMERSGEKVTSLAVKNLFVFGTTKNRIVLIQYSEEYIIKISKLVGIDYSPSTIQRYNITLKLFKSFLFKIGKVDMYLDEINDKLIPDFIFYLKSERKCQQNTVVKYVRGIARIIREAIKDGYILEKEENLKLSIKAEETTPEYLTKEELNRLIEKELTIERLSIVRDIFVFCCFTGLAFIDVKQLKPSNIEKDNNGNTWIRINRQKTGVKAHIVLLNIPLKIIEKYSTNNYCKTKDVLLPVYSNQKQNAYLKEISDLCGISKNLITHCARHTFATTVTLANKISMESVSRMLGHSDIRMTKHYAKILDETVDKEMEGLKKIWD